MAKRQCLDDVPQEIQDLLYEGKKIEAIKLAREKKGWDLKTSKEKVESVESRMREQFPDALPVSGRSGCGAALLLVVLVGAGIGLITAVI